MTDLYHIFSGMEQDVQHTLYETEAMEHPLIALIRYSLHEQQQALHELLPILKTHSVSLSDKSDEHIKQEQTAKSIHSISLTQIKPYLTLLYQNQEVSEPTVRAWVRAVQWIPSFETQCSDDIQRRFKDMHQRLEQAGTLLVAKFGHKPLKFIVPIAYTETEVNS